MHTITMLSHDLLEGLFPHGTILALHHHDDNINTVPGSYWIRASARAWTVARAKVGAGQ